MQAREESAARLNNILRVYGLCSGQCVNRDKSSILFSPNTPKPVRASLKEVLGISEEAFNERYLGLPTMVGRSKDGTFKYVRESAGKKVARYKGQGLSKTAREVLVKSGL